MIVQRKIHTRQGERAGRGGGKGEHGEKRKCTEKDWLRSPSKCQEGGGKKSRKQADKKRLSEEIDFFLPRNKWNWSKRGEKGAKKSGKKKAPCLWRKGQLRCFADGENGLNKNPGN